MDYYRAFPSDFSFYHLGEVRAEDGQTPPQAFDWLANDAVAFRLSGDVRGLAIMLYPRNCSAPGGDYSSWTELGNVLASRLATRLSAQEGLEVVLSPPRHLRAQDLKSLPDPSSAGTVIRTYLHYRADGVVPVRLALFTAAPANEGAPHV